MHAGFAFFLRNLARDDWFHHLRNWDWGLFAMTYRTYYRDAKQMEIEYQASLREVI